MRRLNAFTQERAEGVWLVTVVDILTEEEVELIVEAETEKEAAFKAMDQVNEQ